jgi:hypothetical protein
VGFPHAVDGKLVFVASELREALTNGIVQMEGIPEDREWKIPFLQERQQGPEILVENGVSAGDVEIREPSDLSAHLEAIVEDDAHPGEGHFNNPRAMILGKM